MRAQDEILRKIEEVKGSDFLQIKTGDFIIYLDYEHAKSYLKPEVMANEWTPNINEKESILKEMLDYMPFAWGKSKWVSGEFLHLAQCNIIVFGYGCLVKKNSLPT